MGWIEERGGSIRARWRVGGEIVTVTCATRSEANAKIRDAETDRRRGTYLDPRGGRMPLADWAAIWMDGRPHLKESSAAADRSRYEQHIEPLLGHISLDQTTPAVVRRWVSQLVDKELSPKTIRNCHGLLYSMLQSAVEEPLIPVNPCKSTKLPARVDKEMHFLTTPEIERLVVAVPEHYRVMVLTAAGTGMRWGEVVGLRRRRVDLLARPARLEVAETLTETGGRIGFGTPKTTRSRRVVSLPDEVVDGLVSLLTQDDPEGLVFTTETGLPIRNRNFGRRVWRPTLEAAGLPLTVRFHDLRHTHAAHLISDGVPLPAVSRRLGHASIQVTSDTYGHLLPEVDDRVLTVVNRMLPRLSAPNPLPSPAVLPT